MTLSLCSQQISTDVFYRVSRPTEKKADALKGLGAFWSTGGRYNRPYQATVYATVDPMVALAEAAFYQAQTWQSQIGGVLGNPAPRVNFPLRSPLILWEFKTTVKPIVVTLPSKEVATRFPGDVREIEIWNPSQHYSNLRDLADQIRHAPQSTAPYAIGIEYPSTRMPSIGSYVPNCYAFFVSPIRGRGLKGRVQNCWNVSLEFCDRSRNSITSTNLSRVDWSKCTCELRSNPSKGGTGIHVPVRGYSANPLSPPSYKQATKYTVPVIYS